MPEMDARSKSERGVASNDSRHDSVASVLVVSLSKVTEDARVLRQVRSLASVGHTVTVIGAHDARAGAAPIQGLDHVRFDTFAHVPWSKARLLPSLPLFALPRDRVDVDAAVKLARLLPGISDLERSVLHVLERQERPERVLVLANDWQALPAALAAHRRFGARVHFDTHEYAAMEHARHVAWRLALQPLIRAIEAAGLQVAASASCVSPSIATSMASDYGLRTAPTVIRNVPAGEPIAPRPVGAQIRVLYHGLFKPDRGILELIDAIGQSPPSYRLVLRGHAPSGRFARRLRQKVEAIGAGRIEIEPMVPLDSIAAVTNAADIGAMVLDPTSPQNRFALPNKLFEYLHGGLMVLFAENTDAARLLEPLGAGIGVEFGRPEAIATLLRRLDAATLDRYKQAAHAAARALTWEREADKLVALLAL